MITFRLTGVRNAVRTFQQAPTTIVQDIENIVKTIMFNDILFKAQDLAKTKLNRNTTGNLSSNIKPFMKIVGKKIFSGLKVDLNRVKYARLHELGGTIRPVNAKALTIPFPGIKGSARDFKNTFVAKGIIFQLLGVTRTGRLRRTRIVGQSGGSRAFAGGLQAFRPLFSLHKGPIDIPPRPYLRPAIEAFIPKIIQEIQQIQVEER